MSSIKPEIMAVTDAMLSDAELKIRLIKAVNVLIEEFENLEDSMDIFTDALDKCGIYNQYMIDSYIEFKDALEDIKSNL